MRLLASLVFFTSTRVHTEGMQLSVYAVADLVWIGVHTAGMQLAVRI